MLILLGICSGRESRASERTRCVAALGGTRAASRLEKCLKRLGFWDLAVLALEC